MFVTSTLGGELSDDDVVTFIDDALERHPDLRPRGIRVSNSIFQRGFNNTYRDIPIAMSPAMYPRDQVEVEFFDD